jgi:hypothetical protein
MGPHGGGVAGEVIEEPGRGERAPIASWGGMRRSLSSANLRSTDSVNPRAVLSRVRPSYRHLL